MGDFGDKAQSAQQEQLADALAKAGIKTREIEIPPPHYGDTDPTPAFCRTCGGKPEIGALCGPCGPQLDKGGR